MQFLNHLLIAVSTVSSLVPLVGAHSWLECVNDNVKNLDAVRANRLNPSFPVDDECLGFPRNKVDHGKWITESGYYPWDLNTPGTNDGDRKFACNNVQRSPLYPDGRPMTVARRGQTLTMRFWGNGHSSKEWGTPKGVDPGLVRVYTYGKPGKQITHTDEFNGETVYTYAGFSENAVTAPPEKEGMGPDDKLNLMNLVIDPSWEDGVYSFVWTWASTQVDEKHWADRWTTCFDIKVEGGEKAAPIGRPSPSQAMLFVQPKPEVGGGSNSGSRESTPASNEPSPLDKRCNAACFPGGMTGNPPCTGPNCAPCRYAAGSNQNCFEYGPDGKCPFAGGVDCKRKTLV